MFDVVGTVVVCGAVVVVVLVLAVVVLVEMVVVEVVVEEVVVVEVVIMVAVVVTVVVEVVVGSVVVVVLANILLEVSAAPPGEDLFAPNLFNCLNLPEPPRRLKRLGTCNIKIMLISYDTNFFNNLTLVLYYV